MANVSVIVPIYGVEKYIERCARSLFEQTLDDIEYLFIDDCTLDRSIEILCAVLEDYPQRKGQVVIHRMEKNSGQAVVRKWGMQHATGEYLIHCDSDDWIDIDMYRAMYEKAMEENADVVVCDLVTTDGKKILKKEKGCHDIRIDYFIENQLFQRDSWSLCNKLFSRNVFNKNLVYPIGNMGEDMVICIQAMLFSNKVAYVPRPFYNYFVNCASITHTFQNDMKAINYYFYTSRENVEILLPLLGKSSPKLQKASIGLEYTVIELLFCVSHIKKYRGLCFNTYPGIVRKVLFSPKMKFKCRLKILLASIYLYPRRINE